MSWHEVHEASHLLEHAITPNVEERLLAVLGNPTTCPHGNPIPGLGAPSPDEIPLDRVQSGDEVEVLRITEEAENDHGLIQYLQAHGVRPGARLRVREATHFNAIVVLEGANGSVTLGTPAAAKLRVRQLKRADQPSVAAS
jgi:DtxR family Mn-dependent transcriptional regulator